MAFQVKKKTGIGGAHQQDLYSIIESLVADLANVKTQLAAVGAKLDADSGVNDADFVSGGSCVTTVGTTMET